MYCMTYTCHSLFTLAHPGGGLGRRQPGGVTTTGAHGAHGALGAQCGAHGGMRKCPYEHLVSESLKQNLHCR